ncbi:MAG TPA: DivIVA domain-containing protein [Micromonospora sp.]|nr:DivIVA domain-containing protein [Micromonospora sp.]
MRNLLRIRKRTTPQPDPAEAVTNQALLRRLTAHRIRSTRFPLIRRWRGYDPTVVQEYLGRVADEVLHLHRQLARAYAETDHIKRHLRQWQTEHATTCRNIQPRTSDRPHWPVNHDQSQTVRICRDYR